MTATRTIDTLRSILFDQLEALANPEKVVDLERSKLVNETAQLIVNTAKVEVEHAKVLKGAITLPFIEDQNGVQEKPFQQSSLSTPANEVEDTPEKALSPAQKLLHGNAGHPWRGMGSWNKGKC